MLINSSLSACNLRKSNERKVLVWKKERKRIPPFRHSMMRAATDVPHYPFHRKPFGNDEEKAAVEAEVRNHRVDSMGIIRE
jgi:hypothetical protein